MFEAQIHLRDIDPDVVDAWRDAFAGVPGVEVSQGDIFAVAADAIVSPANSFGFMDGGIDAVYSQHFGWSIGKRLRESLALEWSGELPVGCAVIIPTGDATIPWMVSAPTMRIPMDVSNTVNAYMAFRAALLSVRALNREKPGAIRSVLCPGLATMHGRMDPALSAKQMRWAYKMVAEHELAAPTHAWDVLALHRDLLTAPGKETT
jgi:O-acetyl-ADP-ribose deacetylase (regulator of RNase III)